MNLPFLSNVGNVCLRSVAIGGNVTEKPVFSDSLHAPDFLSAQYFRFRSTIARHTCALALDSLGLEPVDRETQTHVAAHWTKHEATL